MSISIEPKIIVLYPSAKEFADIVDTVSRIVDEILIHIDQHGFKIRALDPSRIAMLSITLPPEAFQEYSVSEEMGIGLPVSILSKMLKQLKKSDRITIAANSEYVEMLVEGMSVRRYKFRNLEVVAEEMPELSLNYDVEALALSSPLRTALSELTSMCSSIGVSAKGDTLTLFDYDTRKSSYRLSTAAGTIVNLSIRREASAVYDSGYISKVVEVLKLSNVAELKYGAEAPLNLSIEFAGGKIEYYLAQKM